MTPTLSVFEAYQALLRRVDESAGALFARHRRHLRCRRGCYYCCTAISVTPLEYAWVSAVLSELRRTGASTNPLGPDTDTPRIPAHDSFITTISEDSELAEARNTPRCALLRDGVCSMYAARPVICRLHGLPLAYPVFEYDERGHRVAIDDPEVALVWCDLNFSRIDVAGSLREEDIVRMAEIYAELENLNEQFLETEAGAPFAGAAPTDARPTDARPTDAAAAGRAATAAAAAAGVLQIGLDSVLDLTPGSVARRSEKEELRDEGK